MTYHRRVSSTSLVARSALAAAVLVLAAGCGGDDGGTAEDPAEDTTSQQPGATDGTSGGPTTDLPPCADVWVAGATLPRGYRGCEQDGEAVKPDKHPCSYGATIVEFADRFYAVSGKQINEVPSLTDSEQYQRALSACQG
jgi:hypothetical protein